MTRIAYFAAFAALVAFPALADQGPASTTVVAPPSAPEATVSADEEGPDPAKVICRKAAPPTSTRVRTGRARQQICMTQADWDLMADETREAVREMDNPTANEEFLGPRT